MTGRRSKLTPERTARICDLLSQGVTQKIAALASGVAENTYYEWLRDGDADLLERAARVEAAAGDDDDLVTFPLTDKAQFAQSVKGALASGAAANVLVIKKASAKNWQAAAWLVERGPFRDEYRRPGFELSGPEGGPIPIDVRADQVREALQELAELEAELDDGPGDAD